MIMGILIERRTYTFHQYLGAAVITLGIFVFNMSELQKKHSSDDHEKQGDTLYGIILLLTSIIFDGVVGAFQGLLNSSDPTKFRRPDALETMFLMNTYYVLFLLPLTILSGQMYSGFVFIFEAPEMIKLVTLFNLSSAAGQFFIFLTITTFSPLVCTTITTSRKFCSILLSVFRFGHVLTGVQWIAVISVFFGLFLELCSKRGQSTPVVSVKSAPPIKQAHQDIEMMPLAPSGTPLRRRVSGIFPEDLHDFDESGAESPY